MTSLILLVPQIQIRTKTRPGDHLTTSVEDIYLLGHLLQLARLCEADRAGVVPARNRFNKPGGETYFGDYWGKTFMFNYCGNKTFMFDHCGTKTFMFNYCDKTFIFDYRVNAFKAYSAAHQFT